MNKLKLVDKLFEAGLITTKTQGEDIIYFIINEAFKTLKSGEDFRFPPLGVFRSVKRKSLTHYNINTGKKIKTPDRNIVKFYPSINLRDFIK